MNLIIVGVDGSSTALEAAHKAARLAAATEAQLHVITAVTRDSVDPPHHVRVDVARDFEKMVTESADQLRSITERVTTAAVRGRPAEVLVGEAERLGADLIVVGNRRVQSPVARVLGSIATAVAHHAPCDVYIAHTTP